MLVDDEDKFCSVHVMFKVREGKDIDSFMEAVEDFSEIVESRRVYLWSRVHGRDSGK